jgi:TfoX/Sxy family transcriptional regulator of competence genes
MLRAREALTMAYDETLASRIRQALGKRTEHEEKRMFGGLTFMVGGHMCCGVVGDELMVRVGADHYELALAAPHVRPMDFTGRPLTGMIYVAPAGLATARGLEVWLARGLKFAATLPARTSKKKARSRPAAG